MGREGGGREEVGGLVGERVKIGDGDCWWRGIIRGMRVDRDGSEKGGDCKTF